MRPWQGRLVLGSILLAESAWLFALLGAAGALLGLPHVPLSWPGMMTIMGFAMAAGGFWSRLVAQQAVYVGRMLLGAAILYLVLTVELAPGPLETDFGWVVKVARGSGPEDFTLQALVGSLLGTVLWVRGTSLSAAEFPAESLSFSFRIGLVALAIATILDIVTPAELDTFPLVFIFFAAALSGLIVGHLMPETQESAQAGTWPSIIGGLLAAVLLAGLIFAVLRRGAFSYLTDFSLLALDAVLKGLFWATVIPIAFVYNVLVNGVIWIFDKLFGGVEEVEEDPRPLVDQLFDRAPEPPELEPQETSALLEFILDMFVLAFLAGVTVLILFLLAKGFRRMFARPATRTRGIRDSVKESANPAADVVGLVLDLMPGWLAKRKRHRVFSLPDGPQGVVDALKIYYEVLTKAEEEGIERPPHQTSIEFQTALEEMFPRELVRATTAAFNRACYGAHPATDVQIAEMRASLKRLASGPLS